MISIKFPVLFIIFLNLIAFSLLVYFNLIDNSLSVLFFFIFFYLVYIIPIKKVSIGKFSLIQENFLYKAVLLSILLELIYFGIPLLGSINYVDFGFPILHHLSMMLWLLILFGESKTKYFLINSIYCILIFNRQFFLIGVLTFFITNKYNFNKFAKYLLLFFILFILLSLGIYRNYVLEVNFKPFSGFIDLPYLEYYDFILFYIFGPFSSSFDSVNFEFKEQMAVFWNTKPEWYLFSSLFYISTLLSFFLFYFNVILVYTIIYTYFKKRANFYLPILFCFTFFTYFSNVLVSTVFIANFIILELVFFISKFKFSSI